MSSRDMRRPRPKALVRIDPGNAYARLGVSPRASTEEIKRVIDEKRAAVSAQRSSRADGRFGAEEEEMARLQQIEKEIGTPRARVAYDEAHPMNALLTIQTGGRDRWLERGSRAGLVSEWLVAELGMEVLLPSADALPLWAPGGLEPGWADELRPFQVRKPEAGDALPMRDAALLPQEVLEPLSLQELKNTQVGTTPEQRSGKEHEHG
jgi:hypothetical protein